MDYERLTDTLRYALPINRKERFYTGTVLPSLLFHGGLSNLYTFLRQIRDFPPNINEENTKDEFLFYTEYNLKESAGKKSVGAEIFTTTKDTPDIIIQILKPVPAFVIVEAKMFSKLSQNDLNRQMRAQKVAVIDPLEQKYSCQTFHLALVPGQLGFKDTPDYQVLTWQFFTESKKMNLRGNYFTGYLEFALENYGRLVSESVKATTIEGKMSGISIHLEGNDRKIFWVGRHGGKKAIENDVKSGSWEKRQYAVNTGISKPVNGRPGNWLSSIEFAEIVDRVQGTNQ